ncbi:MAG: DUF2807 domain-containing protein [Flavobacterium sp.]|nr:DUF2807 domain-containing protein [Flavobacterium sp.]
MKKINKLLVLLLLVSSVAFSQKKDKIKGSKIVTIEKKIIDSFNALEVSDDVEIILVKGTDCGIEIEADDNLHDAIAIDLSGSILKISSTKKVFGYKKFSVIVTCKDDFNSIVAKDDSKVTAISNVDFDALNIKSFDDSKLYITTKTTLFNFVLDGKSKAELNLKADKTVISLSKNSEVKALITSKEMTFDMYQKSDATIEGDVEELKIRLDNNSNFVGKNLLSKNVSIKTEGYANASIQSRLNSIIDASGKSEIELYGDSKIELKQFADSAILKKKPLK